MLRTTLILIVLLTSLNAYAATFNVKNTAEFRQALEDATVNGEDDTIIMDAGVYKTTDDGVGTFEFPDIELHDLVIQAKEGLARDDRGGISGRNIHVINSTVSNNTASKRGVI